MSAFQFQKYLHKNINPLSPVDFLIIASPSFAPAGSPEDFGKLSFLKKFQYRLSRDSRVFSLFAWIRSMVPRSRWRPSMTYL
jgi:hypothetical protein